MPRERAPPGTGRRRRGGGGDGAAGARRRGVGGGQAVRNDLASASPAVAIQRFAPEPGSWREPSAHCLISAIELFGEWFSWRTVLCDGQAVGRRRLRVLTPVTPAPSVAAASARGLTCV